VEYRLKSELGKLLFLNSLINLLLLKCLIFAMIPTRNL